MATKRDKTSSGRRRLPWCKTCERSIRIPAGWSTGAGVRRHYWRKHPGVMRPSTGEGR